MEITAPYASFASETGKTKLTTLPYDIDHHHMTNSHTQLIFSQVFSIAKTYKICMQKRASIASIVMVMLLLRYTNAEKRDAEAEEKTRSKHFSRLYRNEFDCCFLLFSLYSFMVYCCSVCVSHPFSLLVIWCNIMIIR